MARVAKKKASKKPAASEPQTDVAGAAARVLGEGDAAPGPMTPAQRQKKWRDAKKAAEAKPETPVVVEVEPGDIEMAAGLGATVWDIIAPIVRVKPLDEAQTERLGRALAPLMRKYMPLLADWQYEAAAVLCIFALARECRYTKEELAEMEEAARKKAEGDDGGA